MVAVYRDLNCLRVLIVGCGNIAGGFDQGRSLDECPYTHAGAYRRDGRFKLAACVEPDDKRRSDFMTEWELPLGFRSLREVFDADMQFDVVSICSPTDCHAHDLDMATLLTPKLIFCEKPLTTSLAESERLLKKCKQANIHLAVNYTRRWDKDISQLQADMRDGRWGALRSAVAYYNKGISNNGSHMLDLLQWLMGPLRIVAVGKPVADHFCDDPTVPVWLESADGIPVMLACGHAQDYTIFELQLVFSKGVLVMEEGGMAWRERRIVDSKVFKGYRILDAGTRRTGAYPGAMLRAIDNLYRTITYGEPLASNADSALAVQRLCEQLSSKP